MAKDARAPIAANPAPVDQSASSPHPPAPPEFWVPANLTRRGRILIGILLGSFVGYAYLFRLGTNPYGTFADEALIGVQARRLVHGQMNLGSFGLFYNHNETVAGILPVYSTAPFVWLLGLSDFSLRLTSVVYTLLTFGVLYLIFRRLRVSNPWLPVLIFALMPITIHVGRINFGHAAAILCMALGYYLYLLGRDGQRIGTGTRSLTRGWLLTLLGGIAIAASAYGYPGFFVATPLFLGTILLGELIFRPVIRPRLRRTLLLVAVAALCYLPILWEMRTNPMFMTRFDDKDGTGAGLFSFERAESMLQNYQKYFGLDFLFRLGEAGLPTSFIWRHSVIGAGELSWAMLPLLVFALLTFIFVRGDLRKRSFAPFFLLAVLFPLPDLLTTNRSTSPYVLAIFTSILFVPFVLAWGLDVLGHYRSTLSPRNGISPNPFAEIGRRLISVPVITAIVVIPAMYFVFVTYNHYPQVSSGYWGWQAGPRDMIGYYLDHQDRYDAFIMEGSFNNPHIFFDFYIDDPTIRATTTVGGVELRQAGVRQLFGVTRETWDNTLTPEEWIIDDIVTYPDRTVAFYLIRHAEPAPGLHPTP